MSEVATRSVAYRRLAESIRGDLLSGKYSSGERLPTEAELEQRLAVSRQTIRRAYQDLVADGLIYRVPGRGTFAADTDGMYLRHFGSIDDLMALASDTRMRVTRPMSRRVNVEAAGRLRAGSDVVGVIEFVRLHGQEPFCTTEVFLPRTSEEALRDVTELHTQDATSPTTIIGILNDRLESPITDADQSVTAVAAPQRVSELLGIGEGVPCLRIDRLYISADDQPVELAVSHFRPDLYSYRLRLRRAGVR